MFFNVMDVNFSDYVYCCSRFYYGYNHKGNFTME